MTDKKQLEQAEKANRHPINKLALKLLLQEKSHPDPEYLHVLQLTSEQLEKEAVSVSDLRVREQLDSLYLHWNPAAAATYLQLDQIKRNSESAGLAQNCLDQLDSRMGATVRDYPRANPLP